MRFFKRWREFIKNERNIYYFKRESAKTEPDKYLSIIVDGSDMANYGLPYFSTNSKESFKYESASDIAGNNKLAKYLAVLCL